MNHINLEIVSSMENRPNFFSEIWSQTPNIVCNTHQNNWTFIIFSCQSQSSLVGTNVRKERKGL